VRVPSSLIRSPLPAVSIESAVASTQDTGVLSCNAPPRHRHSPDTTQHQRASRAASASAAASRAAFSVNRAAINTATTSASDSGETGRVAGANAPSAAAHQGYDDRIDVAWILGVFNSAFCAAT
jgi:hypothetical protein